MRRARNNLPSEIRFQSLPESWGWDTISPVYLQKKIYLFCNELHKVWICQHECVKLPCPFCPLTGEGYFNTHWGMVRNNNWIISTICNNTQQIGVNQKKVYSGKWLVYIRVIWVLPLGRMLKSPWVYKLMYIYERLDCLHRFRWSKYRLRRAIPSGIHHQVVIPRHDQVMTVQIRDGV